jgi:hypothetical protein
MVVQPHLERPVVLLRIGRWLLPWVCVLAVAASLAHAADGALVYRLSSAPEHASTVPPPAPAGQRWIELRYADQDGTEATSTCRVDDDRVVSNVIQVPRSQLYEVVVSMCEEVWPSGPL